MLICVDCLLQIKPFLDVDFDAMTYTPSIFFNEFWMLRDTLIPVNETLSEVQVALDLHQMAMWKFTIYSQMEKSFQMQVRPWPSSPACTCFSRLCVANHVPCRHALLGLCAHKLTL